VAGSHPNVVSAARSAIAPLLDSSAKRLLIGIVGPPAAGKSTLAAALARDLCRTHPQHGAAHRENTANVDSAAAGVSPDGTGAGGTGAGGMGIGGASAGGMSAGGTGGEGSTADGPGATGSEYAVAIGMDGFHLARAELNRLGLSAIKGAPETFDAYGFVALLRRLRSAEEPVVYAPVYSRTVHESIGSAQPVRSHVRVVVVEGNYLLLPRSPWTEAAGLLDYVFYLDAPTSVRLESLVRRQRSRGLDTQAAEDWVQRSDEANAALIATTRDRANLVLSRPH
jgi:pantothenate kinase